MPSRLTMRPITSIVLHHSLTRDGVALADTHAIRRYHIETNGWQDIGYHLVQERIGDRPTVVIGRPWPISGAHAPGRNHDSLGYCLVGDFDAAPPDPATWECALQTVRWLLVCFRLEPTAVYGHHEVTPHRTCPGSRFDLAAFRLAL